MAFNIHKHHDDLIFIPLGGAGEIGMNLNLYQYKGKWLMVDCGAGFAEDNMPGIDMLVPDTAYIEQYRDNLLGIVITHSHEDHLGAIQYLWPELQCPIYTTPFSNAFLKAKLAEYSFAKEVKIHEVPCNGTINLDPFSLEFIQITHSAPEMNAVVIKTDHGNIFHTGDWKFDPDPRIGPSTDLEALKKYGDEGILALVGDSTNVFKEGTSGSEGGLRESLMELISQCDQLAVVTTFASNVARIKTIAEAAYASGRKVALVGRSLWRITEAAKQAGYLKDMEFLDDRSIKNIPRDKLLVIATGCQGEALAATNKMASGTHPTIRLVPKDTIIFSSKIIPGNDKKIFSLFNKFVKLGVEVITEKDHFVHVSGHPARDEMRKMYELVRPEVSIPVHGEAMHIHEHAKLARSCGVKHALEVEDGSVVKLASGKAEIIDSVEAGYLGIDGNFLQSPDGDVMRMRRRLHFNGVMCVTLILNKDDRLALDPIIFAPGLLDEEEDADLLEAIKEEIQHTLEHSIAPNSIGGGKKKKGKRSPAAPTNSIENLTRTAIRRVLKLELGKKPPIEIHIEWV